MIAFITRIPFGIWVAVLTAAGALVAFRLAPGRNDVVAGVAAGVALAGGFAGVAVSVFRRIKARGQAGPEGAMAVATGLARAFAGLMLARMIGYVALVAVAAVLGGLDVRGVCVGLVAGTIVFQTMEVVYLRKMS